MVGTVDGKRLVRHHLQGPVEKAESLGIELAEILLNKGAGEILKEIYEIPNHQISIIK
jgi:hydroxymethylbilane synthase